MQFGNLYGSGGTATEEILLRAQDTYLGSQSFTSIVGSGLSGALVIPSLAAMLGKTWAIVRKPDERTHSSYSIEGRIDGPWIFVDDVISTGATLRRVVESVEEGLRYTCGLGPMDSRESYPCVGAWLYNYHGEWLTKERITRILGRY